MSVKRIKKSIKKTAKSGKKAVRAVALTALVMAASPIIKVLVEADDD